MVEEVYEYVIEQKVWKCYEAVNDVLCAVFSCQKELLTCYMECCFALFCG